MQILFLDQGTKTLTDANVDMLVVTPITKSAQNIGNPKIWTNLSDDLDYAVIGRVYGLLSGHLVLEADLSVAKLKVNTRG